MAHPAIFFEGGDGAGKTTQAILLGMFLRERYQLPVVYVSYPVYETFIGRTIGRCLGRWGENQAIQLPTPEVMAQLFALNRSETIPWIKQLINEGNLLFFNRGPLSNIFNVARRVLADEVDWDDLPEEEKDSKLWDVLKFDRDYLRLFSQEGVRVKNLFLDLAPDRAMQLAKGKALSTLGGNPDRHEQDLKLQTLTAQIYQDVCKRSCLGLTVDRIRTQGGSAQRYFSKEEEYPERVSIELDGIQKTGISVAEKLSWILDLDCDKIRMDFFQNFEALVGRMKGLRAAGSEPDFEFRKILGLPFDLGMDFSEEKLELLRGLFSGQTEFLETIGASSKMEREVNIKREREL